MHETSRKGRRNVHVIPTSAAEGGRVRYVAIVAGTRTPLVAPTTQRAAIAAAVQEARQRRSEVVIHRADGRIRDSDSYGDDSPQVKDTRH